MFNGDRLSHLHLRAAFKPLAGSLLHPKVVYQHLFRVGRFTVGAAAPVYSTEGMAAVTVFSTMIFLYYSIPYYFIDVWK